MAKCIVSNADISKEICKLVKIHPCLYDKKHLGYNNFKEREKAFQVISHEIQQKLEINLSSEDVKKRWENVRKCFVRYVNGNNVKSYYLAEDLLFLRPHLNQALETFSKTDNSVIDDNLNDNDEDLTYDDVIASISHAKSVNRDSSAKREHDMNIVPSVSKTYIEKKKYQNEIERKSAEIMKDAMKGIQDVLQSGDEPAEDGYFSAIQQSLLYIPQEYLLECTDGILNIIDDFMHAC